MNRKIPARHKLSRFQVERLEGREVPAAGWTDLTVVPPADGGAAAYIRPTQFRAFSVDAAEMRAVLAQAPDDTGWIGGDALVLTLPGPDGADQRFAVVDAPIMAPELAARFPDIETFRGRGLDDPTATVRLDLTPQGLHAQVLAAAGSWYIDPYYHLQTDVHISYFRRDLLPPDLSAVGPTVGAEATLTDPGKPGCGCALCLGLAAAVRYDGQLPAPDGYPQVLDEPLASFGPGLGDGDSGGEPPTANRSGTVLRTYRAAVAATGEYTTFHGGTVALGQAAIVTAMNRVNQVYENELSIRMVLVANNSSLVYTNASTDPYSNTNGSAMLTQNQSNIDSIILNVNYDIGHVFSTGGGGVASLGSVGNNSRKAQGVTGLPQPAGDAFYIDFVAHEIGHQYGGSHTFNTSADSQRSMNSAYEPGSGSTIQAYAGVVGTASENLQNFSDPYFHSRSFDQMIAHVDNVIPLVGTRTATGNTVPTVSAGADYVIPAQTPFVLTATGSDADGDTMTYTWEQRNLGDAVLLTTADNGASPLFRSWTGTTDPSRTFPRLSNLLANTLPRGEKLPTVDWAAMNFRVTARDNRSGGGAVNTDDMSIRVVNTGSAFAVTAPNTAITWTGGSVQTVTWNVAGTTAAPINAATVAVTLSTDGGLTYPIVLAAAEANDGVTTVTVPNIDSTTARVRVQPVGNIFFDISNANFTIRRAPAVEGTALNGGDAQRSRVTSLAVTYDTVVTVGAGAFTLTRVGLPGGEAGDDLTISSGGASPQITFTTATVGGRTVATLSFNGTGAVEAGSLADGVWRLTVVGSAVTRSGTPMSADYTTPTTGTGRIARLFGDGNGDALVDGDDFLGFVAGFGVGAGEAGWQPGYDANGDALVDGDDFLAFVARFGVSV